MDGAGQSSRRRWESGASFVHRSPAVYNAPMTRCRVRAARALLGAMALCAAIGCATSKPPVPDRLPQPSVVLVYQFAVDAEDAIIDTFGPGFTREREPKSKRAQRAREVAGMVQLELVRALTDDRIPARAARVGAPVPLDAVLIKGQFVRLAPRRRLVVGVGHTGDRLRVNVQGYQMTEGGPRRLLIATHPGDSPTTEEPEPGVVVAPGMEAATELGGEMDVRARDLAEQLARKAVGFYDRQGWSR